MSRSVPYHAPSRGFAKQHTAGVKDPVERYKLITEWITRSIGYDYIKAANVAKKRGILPDPAGCWHNRIGICQDIAALAVNMLTAVGIKAVMCVGHADRQYHAWAEARIGGKVFRYDRCGMAKQYTKERVYGP